MVGVSETWVSGAVGDSAVVIENYEIIRLDRISRGGGICLYLRKVYKFAVLSTVSCDNYECLWVKIMLPTKILVIGLFHRPPNTNAGQFLTNLEDELVCFGDFGMKQVIDTPTTVTLTSSTLIELIFINSDEVSSSGVDVDFSDHYLTYCEFTCRPPEQPPLKYVFRSLNTINMEQISNRCNGRESTRLNVLMT